LKSCIASHTCVLKFLDNGQCQVVLPPSLFGRKRQIDVDEVHIESGAAGFFNGKVGGWIRLWVHPCIIGGLAGEIKILGIPAMGVFISPSPEFIVMMGDHAIENG